MRGAAGGEVIETVEVPRHAVGPELTQLGLEEHARRDHAGQAFAIVPLPALRRFATVRFPDIGAGATRRCGARSRSARGHPSCACTTTRPRGWRSHRSSARARRRLHGVRLSRAATPTWWAPKPARRSRWRGGGRRAARPRAWPDLRDRRYDFYHPPHQPELPSIWARSTSSRPTAASRPCTTPLRAAVKVPFADTDLQLRMHFSHWYAWGTMIYARFVVPDGGGGPEAVAFTTASGRRLEAAFSAGAVMNDHHGVGLVGALHGAPARQVARHAAAPQGCARSQRDHEPGQARAMRRPPREAATGEETS